MEIMVLICGFSAEEASALLLLHLVCLSLLTAGLKQQLKRRLLNVASRWKGRLPSRASHYGITMDG